MICSDRAKLLDFGENGSRARGKPLFAACLLLLALGLVPPVVWALNEPAPTEHAVALSIKSGSEDGKSFLEVAWQHDVDPGLVVAVTIDMTGPYERLLPIGERHLYGLGFFRTAGRRQSARLYYQPEALAKALSGNSWIVTAILAEQVDVSIFEGEPRSKKKGSKFRRASTLKYDDLSEKDQWFQSPCSRWAHVFSDVQDYKLDLATGEQCAADIADGFVHAYAEMKIGGQGKSGG